MGLLPAGFADSAGRRPSHLVGVARVEGHPQNPQHQLGYSHDGADPLVALVPVVAVVVRHVRSPVSPDRPARSPDGPRRDVSALPPAHDRPRRGGVQCRDRRRSRSLPPGVEEAARWETILYCRGGGEAEAPPLGGRGWSRASLPPQWWPRRGGQSASLHPSGLVGDGPKGETTKSHGRLSQSGVLLASGDVNQPVMQGIRTVYPSISSRKGV